MASDLSKHYNQPFHDLDPAMATAAKHSVEGMIELGLAVGMLVESGGVLGIAAGGTLFGLMTSGLVNLGSGFAEFGAIMSGTPINHEAMETGLGIAASPLNVGLVAAATTAGLSAQNAVEAAEMFEVGMSVQEIAKGHGELENLLTVEKYVSDKIFDHEAAEPGSEAESPSENVDGNDESDENDGDADFDINQDLGGVLL